MNKLILLSEVRNEINNDKLLKSNKIEDEKEDYSEMYVTFKEKFMFFQNNEELNEIKSTCSRKVIHEKNIAKIMERIFLLSNYMLINFINSIYNDALSINTKIKFFDNHDTIIQNCSNYIVNIFAQDDYRKFEYKMQFQTTDDENLAIIISKKDLTINNTNVVSFNKKKKEYENDSINAAKSRECYTKCMIILNSNIQVPDEYEFKSDFHGQSINYKVDIIKGWKYDFKQLFKKDMYLLFPFKVIDLRKRLLDINMELVSKELIKDEILRFFTDMNRYLIKIKELELITDNDIKELNFISIDLLNCLVKDQNELFIEMKTDIQATLKEIVV